MTNNIKLVQIDPEELVGLISLSVKSLFNDFVKELGVNSSDEILTPKEVCKLFKIDNSTLCRWGQKQKVKCYGIAGSRYYKKSELMESLVLLNNSQVVKFSNFNNVA